MPKNVLTYDMQVEIGDKAKPVTAWIRGVYVAESIQLYRVVWWDGSVRHRAWLTRDEVRPVGDERYL